MPSRVVVDDDEQIIADLLKRVRRLETRQTTTRPYGTHDEFTVAATPETTFQLTYIPVDGTCAMYVNGLEQTEDTDYTVNYDTTTTTVGLVTFVTALTTGDKIDFRYLVTDWLAARALVPDMDVITDNFNDSDHAALGDTSDGKAAWNIILGPWEILTNQAHATSVTGGTAGNVAYVVTSSADGTIRATLATNQVSIAFRIQDGNNFYAAFNNAVCKVTAGTFSSIITYPTTSTFDVVLSGSLITVKDTGGSTLGTATDATFSTPNHGIHAQRALSSDLIDDWSWTAP